MSKGSKRRPSVIGDAEFLRRYRLAFADSKTVEQPSRRVGSYDVEPSVRMLHVDGTLIHRPWLQCVKCKGDMTGCTVCPNCWPEEEAEHKRRKRVAEARPFGG